MSSRWLLVASFASFAWSCEKKPPAKEEQPPVGTRANPGPEDDRSPIATSPEIEGEVKRVLELATAAVAAPSEACKPGLDGTPVIPTIEIAAWQALAAKQPAPASAKLSNLAIGGALERYRSGTLERREVAKIVEPLHKLKRLGVYQVTTWQEGDAKTDGTFAGRLVLVDVAAKQPICHVPLVITVKHDDEPDDPDERGFASRVRKQVAVSVAALFE